MLNFCGIYIFPALLWLVVAPSQSNWVPIGRAKSDSRVWLRFALKHSNSAYLERHFWEVSDMSSPSYGQHWSLSEVADLVSPSKEHMLQFLTWLSSYLQERDVIVTHDYPERIQKMQTIPTEVLHRTKNPSKLSVSPFGDYITLHLSVAEMERVLDTKCYTYKRFHEQETFQNKLPAVVIKTSRDFIPNIVPSHIQSSILAYITGVTDFKMHRAGAYSEPTYGTSTDKRIKYDAQLFELDLHIPNLQKAQITKLTVSEPQLQLAIGIGSANAAIFIIGTICPNTENIPQIIVDSKGYHSLVCPLGSFIGVDVTLTHEYSIKQETISISPQLFSFPGRTRPFLRLTVGQLSNYYAYSFIFTFKFYQAPNSIYEVEFKYMKQVVPSRAMVPSWVKAYYGISPSLIGTDPRNMQAVGSLYLGSNSGGYYSPNDLNTFYMKYKIPDASITRVEFIGVNNASSPDVETELDIQWLSSMGAGVKSQIWHQITDSWNPIESIFEEIQKANQIPYVLSLSYGASEIAYAQDPVHVKHINEALQSLALLGITVLVSSGDTGAYFNPKCTSGYMPSFLATSPYVLAVGATQLQYQEGSMNGCPAEVASSTATGSLITSGGGFSTIFPRPTYQNNALSTYFNEYSHNTAIPANANKMRGYPDVSFLGHNFDIIVNGQVKSVDGTSASSPSLAGLLSLANDYRLQNGLSTFGFINPLLYQIHSKNSNAFRDIVQGANNCSTGFTCCKQGYQATTGWDPVTGLGSIDFKAAWIDLITSLSSTTSSNLPSSALFSAQYCDVEDLMSSIPGNQGFPIAHTKTSSYLSKFFSNPIVVTSLVIAVVVGLFICIRLSCWQSFKSSVRIPLLKDKNKKPLSYNTL